VVVSCSRSLKERDFWVETASRDFWSAQLFFEVMLLKVMLLKGDDVEGDAVESIMKFMKTCLHHSRR